MAAEAESSECGDGGGEIQKLNNIEIPDMKSEASENLGIQNETLASKKENNDEPNAEKLNDNNQQEDNPDNSFFEKSEQEEISKNENLLNDISKETLDISRDTLDTSRETLDNSKDTLDLSIDQNDEVLPSEDKENENANEERFRVDRKQLENLLKGKRLLDPA